MPLLDLGAILSGVLGMDMMRKVAFAIIASASALAAQADAWQGQTAAAPTAARPMTLVYPGKGASSMTDLPIGAHRIPDSNVIISGHQGGSILGALFGVGGILVQNEAGAAAGKQAVGNVEDRLRFDVNAKAAEMTAAIMARDGYRQSFTMAPGAAGGTLSIAPYVVLTFVKGTTDVRPYIVLKTVLSSPSPGTAPRVVKYFCCEGKALPLTGPNGLSENNGERLKQILTGELETAIHVMLINRPQPRIRDSTKKIRAEGHYPFIGKPWKFKVYDLGQYKDYRIYEIPGGGVIGGVHIAEPSALEITGANAN